MNILILPGDGIGKEVTAQAARVLKAVLGSKATYEEAPIGGEGVKAAGTPLPPATLALAKQADAILFGAVGLPGDELGPRNLRPGGGLLQLRRELALYANFRPAFLFPELVGASSLKPELVEGLDLIVLRELNGDIYYGTPRGISVENGVRVGVNTMRYSEPEIERIAHVGFKAARGRRKKLCSVDKANVLETMVLWRETVAKVASTGRRIPTSTWTPPDGVLRAPKQFDLILAPNMFGDILSDAAAMLTGHRHAALASLGRGHKGLTTGAVLRPISRAGTSPIRWPPSSAAMLLRHSFGRERRGRDQRAVRSVLGGTRPRTSCSRARKK
jgi:3-isopropylmalate dehydrogenase